MATAQCVCMSDRVNRRGSVGMAASRPPPLAPIIRQPYRKRNSQPMPLTFQHQQLPNGLDIIAENNPDSHSTAIGTFVNTGARDDEVTINGDSSFPEHLMFKGSEEHHFM